MLRNLYHTKIKVRRNKLLHCRRNGQRGRFSSVARETDIVGIQSILKKMTKRLLKI